MTILHFAFAALGGAAFALLAIGCTVYALVNLIARETRHYSRKRRSF
jgi:hypothetical protein